MKIVVFTILILAALGGGLWLLISPGALEDGFTVRELSSKIVYTLLEGGQLSDLRKDCAVREGSFNTCGSMCEAGDICATVCAYTCEFSEPDVIDDLDDPVSIDNNEAGNDQVIVNDNIECGIKSDGTTVQCPFNFTCFTHNGSPPTCSDNPCSVCESGEECLQLESYPVQIRCAASSSLKKGGQEGDVVEISDPSPTLPLVRGEGDIKVSSPSSGQEVISPITVAGEARVFEGTVIIQVTSLDGTVLIEEVATARAPNVGQLGPFSAKISYSFSATKEGFVKVFSESARDGSAENLIEIPVKFK